MFYSVLYISSLLKGQTLLLSNVTIILIDFIILHEKNNIWSFPLTSENQCTNLRHEYIGINIQRYVFITNNDQHINIYELVKDTSVRYAVYQINLSWINAKERPFWQFFSFIICSTYVNDCLITSIAKHFHLGFYLVFSTKVHKTLTMNIIHDLLFDADI